MNARLQIIKWARIHTGIVRLARNSPGNPEKLVRLALNAADKLTGVSRTLTDDRDAMAAWKSAAAIESMVHASFGYRNSANP
jgi:hypothetical protein